MKDLDRRRDAFDDVFASQPLREGEERNAAYQQRVQEHGERVGQNVLELTL